MNFAYFPIRLEELKAKLNFVEISESTFDISPFHITARYLNHPTLCLGYRVEHNGKVFVSVFDNEPYRNLFTSEDTDEEDVDQDAMAEADKFVDEMNSRIIKLLSNADLVVYDSQYRMEEYETKKGWGHSTVDHAIEAAMKGNCKRLALFHHDPLRTDAQVDDIQRYAKNKVRELNGDIIVFCARERLEVEF